MNETIGASTSATYLSDANAPPALDARRHALFVDLDGTLVEFQARPEDVVGDPDLVWVLRAVARDTDGAIALLTGRTVADADRVVRGALDNIAGLHGADLRRGTGGAEPLTISAIGQARGAAAGLISSGVLNAVLEDKGASIALHFRHAPQSERHVFEVANELALVHGMQLLAGRMVFELTFLGNNKGNAVAEFMRQPPFVGRIPIAIGDDWTDEDAFKAARARGGLAILVGSERASAATHRLANVRAVREWLAESGHMVGA